MGKALNRSPFPESLVPESSLQTTRPAARPICIRIRVNKAWGVRAAECQECCRPSRALERQELGEAGQVQPWLEAARIPQTYSKLQQFPVSFPPCSSHPWPCFRVLFSLLHGQS